MQRSLQRECTYLELNRAVLAGERVQAKSETGVLGVRWEISAAMLAFSNGHNAF
jgi:hypothetical protein